MKISRAKDSRAVKAIVHRIADIPSGVAVKVADLGGSALYEGTPLVKGSNGLYEVKRTGKVVTQYTSGTSLEIAKGTHFKVGDKIAPEGASMYAAIAAIDKTGASKDVITLVAQFSAGLAVGAKLILVTAEANSAVGHGAIVQGAVTATDTTTINVDKGHTLAVGDYIAGTGADPMTGKAVANIDRGNDGYDVITIGAANGKALADNEELKVVTASNGVTAKTFAVADTITKQAGKAVAIVGTTMDVTASTNLEVDAWLMAVVTEANSPVITDEIKAELVGIQYV